STATPNMLWAMNFGEGNLGTRQVVRIGPNGSTTAMRISNLPMDNYIVGADLPNGYMVIYRASNTHYYVIDVDPTRVDTYLELVDPTNGFVLQSGPEYGIPLSRPINIQDWVYRPDGLLWSITYEGYLVTVDPYTGAVSDIDL